MQIRERLNARAAEVCWRDIFVNRVRMATWKGKRAREGWRGLLLRLG
jgi:hypothetical protein